MSFVDYLPLMYFSWAKDPILLVVMERVCPGFGWDRVNFFLSSWYSAVFWISCENNVDNTLMFWLLLSQAYPKLKIFQFPMLCQQADVQEDGREHSQSSWPELAKGVFHTMERHAQYINWVELARGQGSLLGHQSVGGEQLHCASLSFFPSPSPSFFVIFL